MINSEVWDDISSFDDPKVAYKIFIVRFLTIYKNCKKMVQKPIMQLNPETELKKHLIKNRNNLELQNTYKLYQNRLKN